MIQVKATLIPAGLGASLLLALALAQANEPGASAGVSPIRLAQAAPRLAPNYPERYTVVRGDTLWDISGMFLRDPWHWPEIWYLNPQIANPHLIYPGDVISLVWVDGRPQLRIERGTADRAPPSGTERLSPQVRVESLDQAIKTIPYELIAPFLSKHTVLSKKEIKRAPYVVAIRDLHLIAGTGFDLYVRSDEPLQAGANYALYHIGDKYRDPDTGKTLGQEAIYVGQGYVSREGDPATLRLSEAKREVLVGDRLFPVLAEAPLNFFPRAPEIDIDGKIVAVVDGVSLVSQYQIVVLNRGADDGLEAGHVLEIFQTGPQVRDRVRRAAFFGRNVRLPDERAGVLMVFKTTDDLSYALVMSATSEIKVADAVRTP